MNPEDAVLDEIDRLVDESLAKPWDEISGYDNDINQPECRCGADWHGLPWGGCPGSESEGPVDDPWSRKRAWINTVAATPYRYDGGAEYLDEGLNGDGWIEIGRLAPEGLVFTHHPEMFAGADSAFAAPITVPQWPAVAPDPVMLLHRRLMQLFGEVDSTVLRSGILRPDPHDQPEEPETPQQRALPRPSATPPMWAPRADGRRRR